MRQSRLAKSIAEKDQSVTGAVSQRVVALALLMLAMGGVIAPGASLAQDMEFSVEETGQPAAPPAEGPPSETLANALALYQRESYQEAAVQLQRVVEGETNDPPGNVQKAQFFLGKALYHLRFYQSALSIFDEIGQLAGGHIYFAQTLQWLAQLASQLPEPAGIVEKIGRFGVDQLEQFNTPESAELYNSLLYLMGRYQYAEGEFETAIELFQKLDKNSEDYVQGRFFEGISYVRMRQVRPAIASFRAIIDAIEEGDAKGVDDEARMLNLARMSLARVYYTAANRTNIDTGEREVDGRLLGAAVDMWSRVSQSSEYWLDALFESSWAFFLADQYSRALGNVHTIFSPYFTDAYYPEALVLKAVTFFMNCQLENAAAMVGTFHEKYDPVQRELQEVLKKHEDNNQFFEFLQKVRAGKGTLSPQIRGIVSTALADRTLLRHVEYVKLLEAEEARLEQTAGEFKTSSIGARILQDIAVAKSFAVDQTGDLARGRYSRLIEELQNLQNQIDTVDLEIATAMRGNLSQEAQEQMTGAQRSSGGDVEVDEEHQVWPFNGEYWRDELGFYRQQVTYQCGR